MIHAFEKLSVRGCSDKKARLGMGEVGGDPHPFISQRQAYSCPSSRQEAGQQPDVRVRMFRAAPSSADSGLNHPAPQEEGRIGGGLGPGFVYIFLKSFRGTDVGS